MMASKTAPSSARFGAFEVDFESRELRKRGMRVRLEEKPFQILELLLERPGHVVTRQTLCDKLWPDTHVGYEQNLNTAINKLRVLLGDSSQSPRFVETLPRVGYRFIAPVDRPGRTQTYVAKKMLAVLPFENLSGDPEQEFFPDGLTEELISHLGRLNPKRLGVIARTSAIQYKGAKKIVREIARELGVEYILEGSVRRQGTSVRISAELIDARDQTHLWAASYDRELRDVLAVQHDVALQVVKALAVELLPGQDAARSAADPAAHESYLRGRFFSGQRSEEALTKAIACFEQALALDPNFARASYGIADCCGLLCWFGALSPREAGPRAAEAASRALRFDDSLGEAHASMGLVRYWFEWDWHAAEQEFLRAIELNPSCSSTHQWYASFLGTMGRVDEAREEHELARQLDPLSLIISMGAADPYFYAHEYGQAIAHLRRVLEQEPRFFPALFNLGRVYVQNGMYSEAVAAFEKAVQLSGNREGRPALAHAYAKAGRTAVARSILAEMKINHRGRYLASPMIARIHLGLGEIDEAFEWLRKGIEERSYWIVFLKMDPVYDEIRSDPRFQNLLRAVRLAG
jgi:TolB-like protein/tetratricopeptide (TPR) repeat protein